MNHLLEMMELLMELLRISLPWIMWIMLIVLVNRTHTLENKLDELKKIITKDSQED